MTSQHKRWTEITGKFPEPKYYFSTLLTNPGDFIRTYAMPMPELLKVKKAAEFWAWYKKYTIKTQRFRKSEDTWELEITLISKVRKKHVI